MRRSSGRTPVCRPRRPPGHWYGEHVRAVGRADVSVSSPRSSPLGRSAGRKDGTHRPSRDTHRSATRPPPRDEPCRSQRPMQKPIQKPTCQAEQSAALSADCLWKKMNRSSRATCEREQNCCSRTRTRMRTRKGERVQVSCEGDQVSNMYQRLHNQILCCWRGLWRG